MKYTLIDMTQSVLSSLGSDEVNSIGDNPESLQVAEIIRQSYFNFISRLELPEQTQLIQLEPSLNADAPALMYVPDSVQEVLWIKYFDSRTDTLGYCDVRILPVTDFINLVTGFNPNETDVASLELATSTGTYTFYYKTQKQPQFCTIINNRYIVFDGFDSTVDSTLQASKTMAFGKTKPVFVMEDTFVPDLNDDQFPLLLNEAKALAFFELKQSSHPKAEMEIKRGRASIQKHKSVSKSPTAFEELPDFGRRTYSGTSYFKSRGWDRP